jgi:hypothetical protein
VRRSIRHCSDTERRPRGPIGPLAQVQNWRPCDALARGRTQLNVITEHGPDEELARIGRRFVPEILARVAEEQAGSAFHPTYLQGEFYLRRRRGGIQPNHPHCQLALKRGVLNARFVSKLASWDLELLCP